MSEPIGDVLPLGVLPPGARVLDLGCGSGTIAYAGFPQLQFFGADQYTHRDTIAWPPNARLILAEAERLPWADATFDAALCNFVFEHFREPSAALRELDRVVRPAGLLYASIPRATSLQDRLYRFTTKGGGHLQRYSLETFIYLVYRESGFKLEGLAPVPAAFTWLRDVPHGELIRRLLYRSFRLWRQATGSNPLDASDFLLLFRRGEQRGFKYIEQVCSNCGNSFADLPASSNGHWKCPDCAFQNILVSG